MTLNTEEREREREVEEGGKKGWAGLTDWLTSHVKQLVFQVANEEAWSFYTVDNSAKQGVPTWYPYISGKRPSVKRKKYWFQVAVFLLPGELGT